MLNQVVLVGKIIEEPVIKEFGNNNQMAVLLLEVERNIVNQEKTSDIFQVILWKNTMSNYLQDCQVNAVVGIKGRLQANNFITREKNKFYSSDIIAEKISILKE